MAGDITLQQFKEFLSAKKAETRCPVCRQPEWGVPQHDGIEDEIISIGWFQSDKDHQYPIDQPLHETVLAVCRNCGFVRPHSANHIRAWIAEQNDE